MSPWESSAGRESKGQRSIPNRGNLVRKVGFEPTRLTAPPPQDGASASSATSAMRGSLVVIVAEAPISEERASAEVFEPALNFEPEPVPAHPPEPSAAFARA